MKRDSMLWLAAATGPIVWILTFGADVSLSDWPCRHQDRLLLYALSALAVALTAVALTAGLSQWRVLGRGYPGESSSPLARDRAIAIGGIGLNLLFLLVLIAQTIPTLILKGCE